MSSRNKGVYEPEFRLIFMSSMLFGVFGYVGWAGTQIVSFISRAGSYLSMARSGEFTRDAMDRSCCVYRVRSLSYAHIVC